MEIIESPAVPAYDTSTRSCGPPVTFDSYAQSALTSSLVSTTFRNANPTVVDSNSTILDHLPNVGSGWRFCSLQGFPLGGRGHGNIKCKRDPHKPTGQYCSENGHKTFIAFLTSPGCCSI